MNKYSKKKELDKFYTKESVAIDCIKHLRLRDYETVIEPSAGSGVFSNNIKHKNLLAFDLHPENSNIKQQDWFDYSHTHEENLLIIGNPPFGLRNTLSKKFIQHSISIGANTIAMILPNVYKKHTLQSIFPDGWRLKKLVCIPDNAFTVDGEPYHVPCSFFIFDRSEGTNLMFDITLYQHSDDFEFTTKQDADWFVLGASPKTVKKVKDVNPTNRGYYIKATNLCKKELKKKFENTYWDGNSSANGGVSWFTKPEIIKSYIGDKKWK